MRRLATFGAWFLCQAASAAGQNVIVVDSANGPGTHYVDLPPAVAAAADGDRIVVRAGHYSPFSVFGKALRITGAGANQSVIDGPPVSTAIGGYVSVIQVPNGSVFRLEAIGLHGAYPSSSGSPEMQFVAFGSAGKIVLADVDIGPPAAGGSGLGLWIHGAEVHAHRSVIRGGSKKYPLGANWYAYGDSGAMVSIGGVLVATDCNFVGGDASLALGRTGGGYAAGGHGIWNLGAGVRVSGGRLIGGAAEISGGTWSSAGGGVGLASQLNSWNRVDGAATVSGGSGAFGGAPPSSFSPAVYQSDTASVAVHAPVALVAGGGAPTTSGLVALGLPALPTLSCIGTTFADGAMDAAAPSTIALTYANSPGAPFVLLIAGSPAYWTPFPAAMTGELLLADYAAPLFFGVTDATGSFSFAFTAAAASPALPDVPLHLQAAVFDAALGQALMSAATVRSFR
jgi:hypothetical protein